MADLPQRVGLHRFHQRFEHVAAFAGGVLEVAEAVAFASVRSFDLVRLWRATLRAKGALNGAARFIGGIDFVRVVGRA